MNGVYIKNDKKQTQLTDIKSELNKIQKSERGSKASKNQNL